jgi:hypothetical protein
LSFRDRCAALIADTRQRTTDATSMPSLVQSMHCDRVEAALD